jgi:hypothetical protein
VNHSILKITWVLHSQLWWKDTPKSKQVLCKEYTILKLQLSNAKSYWFYSIDKRKFTRGREITDGASSEYRGSETGAPVTPGQEEMEGGALKDEMEKLRVKVILQ